MPDLRFDALVAEFEQLERRLREQADAHRRNCEVGGAVPFALAAAYADAAVRIRRTLDDEKWDIPVHGLEERLGLVEYTLETVTTALFKSQTYERVTALERTVADLEERVEALGKGQVGPSGRGTWSATYGAEEAGGDS